MNQAVIKFYRRLLSDEFPNSGGIETPSIFIEAVGEKLIDCGNTGNYMQLYLQVEGEHVLDARYLCACEPVANVAVEILCMLLKGKTVDEAANFSEEPFYQILGSQDEELRKKVLGLLEMLNDGLTGYRARQGSGETAAKSSPAGNKLNWDGVSSA